MHHLGTTNDWRHAAPYISSAVLLLLLAYAGDALLLLFVGLIVAVGMRAPARLLGQKAGLSDPVALVLVVVALAIVLGLAGWGFAAEIGSQFQELRRRLPEAANELAKRVERATPSDQLSELTANLTGDTDTQQQVINRLFGIASTGIGAIASFFIVVLIGLYIAADPRVYQKGLLKLLPQERREAAHELLLAWGSALETWFVAKVIAMAAVAVLTWIGLMILEIPMALALASLTGVFTFIPNFGPIASAIPPILLGLLQGLDVALYVLGLYLFVQFVESYFITPLLQQRKLSLPPALVISAQVLFGFFYGLIGVFAATPFIALVVVAVEKLAPNEH